MTYLIYKSEGIDAKPQNSQMIRRGESPLSPPGDCMAQLIWTVAASAEIGLRGMLAKRGDPG